MKKNTKKRIVKTIKPKAINYKRYLGYGVLATLIFLGGYIYFNRASVGINEIGAPQTSTEVLASWNLRDANNFKLTNSRKVTVWQPFNFTTGYVKYEKGAGVRLTNLGGKRGVKIFSVDTNQALQDMYSKIYSGDPVQSLRANVSYEVTFKPTWVSPKTGSNLVGKAYALDPNETATPTVTPTAMPKPSDAPYPTSTPTSTPQSTPSYTTGPLPSYTPRPSMTAAPVPTTKLPMTVEFYSGLNKDGKRQLLSKMTQDVLMPLNTSTKVSFNFNDLNPYSVATLDLVRVYVSPSKETGWIKKYPQASILIEEMSMNGVLVVSRSERLSMQGVIKQEQKNMDGYTQTTLYFEDQSQKKYMANFSWNILVPTSANYTNPYTYLGKTVWVSGWASRWDWMNWVFNDGTMTNINLEIDSIAEQVNPSTSSTPTPVQLVNRYSYLAEPMLLEKYEQTLPSSGVAVQDSSL